MQNIIGFRKSSINSAFRKPNLFFDNVVQIRCILFYLSTIWKIIKIVLSAFENKQIKARKKTRKGHVESV